MHLFCPLLFTLVLECARTGCLITALMSQRSVEITVSDEDLGVLESQRTKCWYIRNTSTTLVLLDSILYLLSRGEMVVLGEFLL